MTHTRRLRRRPAKIEPFWNRTPSFFLYALHPLPLLLSAGLALVSYIFPNVLVTLIIYAVMVKYCFAVLEHTADGKMKPPALNRDVLVENYDIVFKQLAVFILFAWMVSGMANIGWLLSIAVMLLGLLLLPASVMVLAVSESLVDAINPVLLLRMLGRIGWSYLGLYGLLLVVGMAEANLEGFLLERISRDVLFPVYHMINLFFSVIMFHMMGYLLYQSHEALGYSAGNANEGAAPHDDERLVRFQDFMERNLLDAAKAELEQLTKELPEDRSIQEKYCTFLQLHGTDDEKQRYARRYIPSLLSQGRKNDAARVFSTCVAEKAAFPLDSVAHYLPLMQILRSMGKHKDAVMLSRNIHKLFPQAPEVAEIYLDSARILSEDLNRDETARKLLRYIVKRFPDHPCREESQRLLQVLQQVD